MSKIISFLSSTRLMAVLFIVFAAVMAIATFVENEYNTDTARILVYNTKWFEAIMLIFVFNFIGNIKRYKLWSWKKIDTLLLHLSFILILLGAFVTRYISFEGMMPIREGETVNQFYSDKTFLTVWVDGDLNGEPRRKSFEEQRFFSAALDKDNLISNFASNHFKIKDNFDKIPFEVEFKDFIMGAEEVFEETPDGKSYLKLVESSHGERHEHFIEEGTVESIHNILYSYNQQTEGAVNFFTNEKGEMQINTPFAGNYMVMATQAKGEVEANSTTPLNYRSMYDLQGVQFVMDRPMNGKKVLKSNGDFKAKNTTDALVLTVRSQGKEEEVTLMGSKGQMGVPQSFKIGELEFTLLYGSKVYTTPFQVKLNDFIATKYPGTERSYSAFESKVTIIDPDKSFDYRIYMNHVLDHKGYRFFQASFDPDEKGTILSVNHDFWGTWITYIGYTLLYIAMLCILFTKNTRFNDLRKKLNKIHSKKTALTIIGLLFGLFSATAQHSHNKPSTAQVDSLLVKTTVSQEHADLFGSIIVQDAGGRMKPINTFSSELLRKVSKDDHFRGMDSDQVMLSITQFPQLWYHVPIINLPRGNDSIRSLIGIPTDTKFAALANFFDDKGNYKLDQFLDEAHQARVKNKFQEDFIAADEKVNLLYSAVSGQILKIFPIPGHENDKWVSYLELNEIGMKETDSAFIYMKNILPMYTMSLLKSIENKDFKASNDLLTSIKNFQKKNGSNVLPSDDKIKAEILYNKYDIFKKLYSYYMLVSVLMFIVVIIRIFKDNKALKFATKFFIGISVFLFVLHTAGLIARWYVSGHAPWSNAYESMIFVGWATMLFGLIFGRKSNITTASTAFVVGMILWSAHLNWTDPSIGTLQAVLDSYWLMIHVSIIVGSYGPFTLGMMLGVVALLLMIFTTKGNKAKMELNLKEITYINEMALTIGLVMLTIGNFMGGQWANESWGRYWGWDPKETWALISIMVYAFVIHMRFVPALRGLWIYNLISVLAFYSIMMTYFGVNFYLSGLHSYAKGDQVVTPTFVWISVACIGLLAIPAYFKYKKYYKK
ncbi:cytochrome c biogenesis protein CcsA [Flavobacterium dauae]|uniref:cytochrome c biogenesis protein n=1 Tax=Flavobacterium dauae TaxID=1563479 RepID=UPI00101B224C|nr:cytochrome c biogenesis protein CcsA [Flavobacterium dauae]WLD24773.1 cytochrome c biogenesis protein CcsA [Flavobacterium dauae]